MKTINDYVTEANVSGIKKIELPTKDMKLMVELLDRGRAYSDEYYSSKDCDKMEKIWNNVIDQLKQQGAKSVFNGKIDFK